MLVERGTIMQRISWVGIVAGLVVGIVTQLALTLLGVAVGAATIDTLSGLAWSTIIWLAISLAISAFLAGLTAARAAGYFTPAQGRFNGLITGMLLVLALTSFSYNALLGGVRTALGIAGGVGTAVAGAATTAGNNGALQSDPVQSLLSGLNENQISQIIAQNSPELNQTQVQAATNVVTGIANRAANTLGNNLSNISSLPDLISSRVKSIQAALSGPQFVTRLQRQGLTQPQAQETAKSINTLVNDTVTQAQQTADAAARIARNTAITAGWLWLLAAGFILLFSVWGGHTGNDVPQTGATMLPNLDEDEARSRRT